MDALVPHVAVTGVEVPVPVVVQLRAVQVDLLRRSTPQVVVDRGGDVERLVELADALAGLVAGTDRILDRTELAALHIGNRLLEARARPGLRAALADPPQVAGPAGHFATFPDVVRDGLFDVHVLAGLHRQDRDQRVPVVGRGGRDAVDGGIIEGLAEVLDELRLAALLCGDFFLPLAADGLVDITDVTDLDVVASNKGTDVAVPLSANTNDREAELFVAAAADRRRFRVQVMHAGRCNGGPGGGRFKEITACERHGGTSRQADMANGRFSTTIGSGFMRRS